MNPPTAEDSKTLKRLIWLYFWLLIVEGALRKWILPQLAGPLLIVRDPVLLFCFAEAVRRGRFPNNGFIVGLTILGGLAFLISIVQILLGVIPSTVAVASFGLRANFLHLPLIFLIAEVFDRRDVEAIGKWLIIFAVPMTVIVFLQYQSPPDSWINLGAGKGSAQIGVAVSGVEKIRPAGMFSYNTGLGSYLSLATAFLLYDFLRGKVYPQFFGIGGAISVAIMAALAVSRGTILSVAIVGAGAVLCGLLKPVLLRKSLQFAAAAGAVLLVISSLAILREGLTILSSRFEEAEGLKVGILDRFLGGFTAIGSLLGEAPLFGMGLGMGTNAAAGLLTGSRTFLVAEGEWERVVLEMGPLLGLAYLGLRLLLVAQIGRTAFARLDAVDTLPLLLFSATGLLLLNGQFGQPTALGFAVFGSGLCLAAATKPLKNEPPTDSIIALTPSPARIRGRSVYAERLHGR